MNLRKIFYLSFKSNSEWFAYPSLAPPPYKYQLEDWYLCDFDCDMILLCTQVGKDEIDVVQNRGRIVMQSSR